MIQEQIGPLLQTNHALHENNNLGSNREKATNMESNKKTLLEDVGF